MAQGKHEEFNPARKVDRGRFYNQNTLPGIDSGGYNPPNEGFNPGKSPGGSLSGSPKKPAPTKGGGGATRNSDTGEDAMMQDNRDTWGNSFGPHRVSRSERLGAYDNY